MREDLGAYHRSVEGSGVDKSKRDALIKNISWRLCRPDGFRRESPSDFCAGVRSRRLRRRPPVEPRPSDGTLFRHDGRLAQLLCGQRRRECVEPAPRISRSKSSAIWFSPAGRAVDQVVSCVDAIALTICCVDGAPQIQPHSST